LSDLGDYIRCFGEVKQTTRTAIIIDITINTKNVKATLVGDKFV